MPFANMSTAVAPIRTLADLVKRLGGVPLDRVRFVPHPGTATPEDVTEIQEKEGRSCELIEGVLLEKPVGYDESNLAMLVGGYLNLFVRPRNLGIVTGEAGTMEMLPNIVRIPDVAFVSWDRLPGRHRMKGPIPAVAPDLAIEVLSRSNTRGEMSLKREHYFAAGVRLVWEFDPETRTVAVYTGPETCRTLAETDTLDGGDVLPGFALPVRDVFSELDRNG
jgi:Uma2 family endonuclease